MAEVKNAFIKSKMNKDLDDRLLPNGEYRDALNVQISKSDASDVGALENVVGNSLVKNFATLVSAPNIKCIGYFVDEFNNDIYSRKGPTGKFDHLLYYYTDKNSGTKGSWRTTGIGGENSANPDSESLGCGLQYPGGRKADTLETRYNNRDKP